MGLLIDILEYRAEQSLVLFEQAQVNFKKAKEDVTAEEMRTRGVGKRDAEYSASKHPMVKEAATDCGYFRDRATMYATLAIMQHHKLERERHGSSRTT